MFEYEPLKKNGGFILWGDYSSLKRLHTFIMDISERSPALKSDGLAPGMAYDVRKAYEGQRKITKSTNGEDDITLYGVEQVWPTFIAQVAMLRTSLAFITATKFEQGQMYLLEHYLESAIKGSFPNQADEILYYSDRLVGVIEEKISPLIGSRVSYFLSSKPTQRRNELGMLLASLNPLYSTLYNIWERDGVKNIIDPNVFQNRSWDDLYSMNQKL